MGKQARLLTVVIVFVLALPKAIHTAPGPTQSKETGEVIQTPQTTCHAVNGSAAETNQ